MPRPHPKEFRDDVVAVARRGEAPIAQIAKDFGISESCLRNWLQRAQDSPGLSTRTHYLGAVVGRCSPEWRDGVDYCGPLLRPLLGPRLVQASPMEHANPKMQSSTVVDPRGL